MRRVNRFVVMCAALAGALAGWQGPAEAQYQGPVALAQNSETAATSEPTADQTLVNITAGANLNSGNTRAYQFIGGGRFLIVRRPHQFTLDILGTIGATELVGAKDYTKTQANAYIRARYDAFLSHNDALYAAVVPRRDVFAGLDVRLQMQGGYLRNLYMPNAAHRFWTELGYDLTYDNYAAITTANTATLDSSQLVGGAMGCNPPPGSMLPSGGTCSYNVNVTKDYGHDWVHSARVFLGYTNTLSPLANLNLGVETLFDVQKASDVRINAIADFNSSLSSTLKVGILSRVFFDNDPIAALRKKKYDSVVAITLNYTFDSLAGVTQQTCPACDCSADVAKAKESCKTWAAPAGPDAPEAGPASEPPGDGVNPGEVITPPADTVPETAPPATGAPVESAPSPTATTP